MELKTVSKFGRFIGLNIKYTAEVLYDPWLDKDGNYVYTLKFKYYTKYWLGFKIKTVML